MIEVQLPNVTYIGLCLEKTGHNTPPPANDVELNKIIESEKKYIEKYGYVTITKKSLTRFRDYVCESKLGFTNGGYQELKSLWRDIEDKKIHVLSHDPESDLPSTLWAKFADDEFHYFTNKDGKIMNIFELRFIKAESGFVAHDYGTLTRLLKKYQVVECAKLVTEGKESEIKLEKIERDLEESGLTPAYKLINKSAIVDSSVHEGFYIKLQSIISDK